MRLWNSLKKKMLLLPSQKACEGSFEISFEKLVSESEGFAQTLSDVRCCAILCASELMAAKALLACFAAGVTAVPLPMRYGEFHCKKILDYISPDALVTDHADQLSVRRLFASRYEEPDVHPALIMCTSGTTGNPKGVMLTEENILNNVSDITAYFNISERDTMLISRPLYHCAVLTGEFLTALAKGTKIRFFSDSFNPPRMLELIRQYRITVFCGTPTLLSLMSRFVRKSTKTPIRHIAVSGECMGREVGLQIADAFPNAEIYHVYGLTEACPRVSYLPPELFRKYPDCVGIPLKSVHVKILKEGGVCAKTGEAGILYVKGVNVMAGYYNEPKKTASVLKDKWLCTGDIAAINSAGLLKIMGRNDDLIIKAGMNIYPREIESVLKSDRRVHDVLVYGYEAPGGTQIGLKIAGDFATVDEVRRLCMAVLPLFQMPMKIELLQELEKTGSGKIKRRGNYA